LKDEVTFSTNPESQILKILLDIGLIGLIIWFMLLLEIMKSCKNLNLRFCFLGMLFLSVFNVYSWFVPTYLIFSLFIYHGHSSRIKINK